MKKDFLCDLKFYRIINGYFDITVKDQNYKIVYPDHQKKYEAEKLYVSLMLNSRFDIEYLNDKQLADLLASNNIWCEQDQTKLESIEQEIDKLKIRLYQNYHNEDIKKQAKSELKTLREYQHELLLNKHSLDYLTLEFFANNIKNQYLISQCILNPNDELVFGNNYYELDLNLLKDIISEIEKHQITAEDLKNICMSDVWKRYLCQENIFGPSIYLNDDQANLMSLQKMYNNIRQHPDCPEEGVLEDSDALDGWFLFQKQQNKKNKKKNEALSKVRGKVGNHDFVYVITNDKNEAEAIEDLNDVRGKELIKSVRDLNLQDGESVKWKDIPYIKQEIQSQAYRNQKQGVPTK